MRKTRWLGALPILGLLLFAGAANAQVAPLQVTSSTTVTRTGAGLYTLTTTGTVTPPPPCNPNHPDQCLPPICPPGSADHAYCVQPRVCSGFVTVRITTSSGRVVSVRVRLQADCTFKAQATLRLRGHRGRLTVSALFEGNAYLLSSRSSAQIV